MEYLGVEIKKCEGVYPPSEDSLLLARVLRPYLTKGVTFLEIGVGTGFISILAARQGCIVTGTDICGRAIKCAKTNARLNEVTIELRESDLFTDVHKQYELIVFNPPYLPATEDDTLLSPPMQDALVGGKRGNELTLRFIEQVRAFLVEDGLTFLVTSSRANTHSIIELAREQGFEISEEKKKRFHFEELLVLKLERKR